MKLFIGVKMVNAKPMTRQEYNDLRGWKLPDDENGNDEGFLVEYIDGGKPNTEAYNGYVSWSPKEVFENAYNEIPSNTLNKIVTDELSKKQLIIDSLMLEYCPDEMTVEQIENYAKYQVLVDETQGLADKDQALHNEHVELVFKSLGLTPEMIASYEKNREDVARITGRNILDEIRNRSNEN